MYGGPMMGGWGGWGGYGLFGFAIGLVFWVALAVGIVLVVRWLVQASNQGRVGGGAPQADAGATPRQSALEIVGERYARGEISKDEFEQIKKDLEE